MYLKQLDILGFKSFANKTILRFSPGITAVVGPNGCGKTNILDALRWVLGEQKVSLLRGSKMEEVIFNGTRDMKPLGMAEVTLNVVNNRGVLPTEYHEVQVTRRLFRSGESEYLLNKVPCRLRDIHELFFDTGVGAHSYSVIQQDMIDSVISDRAEERRFLFEEAAGITKYKQRKKAALRKLEATEGDLLRLRDIYSEVQTQVRSLNRQQKKAQRYQSVVDDIKNWDLYLSAFRLREVDSEKEQLRTELVSCHDLQLEKEALLNKVSSLLESDRKKQVDLEQELSTVSNSVYDISEKAHSMEREISILVEKRANARTLTDRNQNDIEGLTTRSHILAEQSDQSADEINIRKIDHDALKIQLREAEATQAETDRRLLTARSLKEQKNQKLLELEGKLSSGRTEEDNLKEQMQELNDSGTNLNDLIEENRKAMMQTVDEIEDHHRTFNNIKDNKEATEQSQIKINRQIEELIEKGEESSHEISNLTVSIEANQAKRELLQDMIVHYEGYTSGVVAVMEIRERWPRIAGTVAEMFVPSDGLETAMEATLGDMAGFLICDDRTTAEEIISYLKSENKGRVGILVPDSGTLNPVVKRPEMDLPEFVGWLDSFVTTNTNLGPLMQAVLARTAVYKSGNKPTEILARLPYGFSAVSTDGIHYSKNIISGGSEDELPLFRREEKLKEQERQIADLNEKLNLAKHERDLNTAALAAARAESGSISEALESLVEELGVMTQKINESDYRRRTLESEIDRLAKEHNSTTEKLEKTRSRQYTLGLDFNQLSGQKRELVDTLSQANEQLQELDNSATTDQESVSGLQVKIVESRSGIEQIESKILHIGELVQEIKVTIEAKKSEIDQADKEIETATENISDLEIRLKTIFKQRSDASERQTLMRTSQAQLMEHVAQKEEQLKEARTLKDSVGDSIHQLEIRINTLDSEIRSILGRTQEEYELDLRTSETNKPDPDRPDDEAYAHLVQLKERQKKFGAVNLLALEEYSKACEREKFLGEQLDDLTTAKDDLKNTISKINHTARQLFNETFEKARGNFKKLFVELFTGGEADIFLEDPDDPLESDIQIVARPRGKKLLSITMMSGGERALTSIALLFSLYLVKPSPFCILDEIDAPLDDANCHRFLNIIRSFCQKTQFIIITHNKISMESASHLYGVTMELPGISKLVAVKFTENSEGDHVSSALIDTSTTEDVVERKEHLSKTESTLSEDDSSSPDLPETVIERLNQNLSIDNNSNTSD